MSSLCTSCIRNICPGRLRLKDSDLLHTPDGMVTVTLLLLYLVVAGPSGLEHRCKAHGTWWACQVSNGGLTHWQAIADPSDAGSAPEIVRRSCAPLLAGGRKRHLRDFKLDGRLCAQLELPVPRPSDHSSESRQEGRGQHLGTSRPELLHGREVPRTARNPGFNSRLDVACRPHGRLLKIKVASLPA